MGDERTKGPQEQADERMLKAATWLDGDEYLGAKASLLALARKIDGWDAVVEAAVDWAAEKTGRRPRVPMHDSTSLGSHTRLLAELGLTAVSRAKLEAAGTFMTPAKTETEDTKGGPDAKHDDVGPADGGKLAKITALRP